MKALVKKYIRVISNNIVLLLGIGLFVHGTAQATLFGGRYYYISMAIAKITIGVVLMAIHLLIRAEKNK